MIIILMIWQGKIQINQQSIPVPTTRMIKIKERIHLEIITRDGVTLQSETWLIFITIYFLISYHVCVWVCVGAKLRIWHFSNNKYTFFGPSMRKMMTSLASLTLSLTFWAFSFYLLFICTKLYGISLTLKTWVV